MLAFTSPAALAAQSPAPLNVLDGVAAALCAACIVGETIADNQMYEFQTEKYRRLAAKEKPGPCAEHRPTACELASQLHTSWRPTAAGTRAASLSRGSGA